MHNFILKQFVICLFLQTYTQYIPLSVYDLQTWMGSPSIFVYDCSNAGLILKSFEQFAMQKEQERDVSMPHFTHHPWAWKTSYVQMAPEHVLTTKHMNWVKLVSCISQCHNLINRTSRCNWGPGTYFKFILMSTSFVLHTYSVAKCTYKVFLSMDAHFSWCDVVTSHKINTNTLFLCLHCLRVSVAFVSVGPCSWMQMMLTC